MITLEALSGYLLEEALAHLLRRNGYRLLTSADEDREALREAGHGLLVRGRGADHQADALGDLLMPAPFSLPVRLFVEGKNRGSKVSLAEVRNAHGTISDVNEHYSTAKARAHGKPMRRFQYRYALFSAKGFKADAQSYALAQQISLVDLSGPAFKPLVKAVDDAAKTVRKIAVDAGLQNFPVRQARLSLRAALDDVDAGRDGETPTRLDGPLPLKELAPWASRFTAHLIRTASGEGLILGFPNAPFVLAMRPASMLDLEDYVAEHGPGIKVRIGFNGAEGVAGDWTITPAGTPRGFRLSFGLPGALETWLLAAPEDAPLAKEMFMSSISLFLENRLVRLLFEPAPAPPPSDADADGLGQGTDATDMSYLRRTLKPPLPVEPEHRDYSKVFVGPGAGFPPLAGTGWTAHSVEALMTELDALGYPQAELIRAAACQGGDLSREQVYEIAGFPQDRTLRGLTRPTLRITAELMEQGLLAPDADYPFQAAYAAGVLATHFRVPPDVVEALRELGPPTGA
jgi:hypothetical protein